MPVLTRAFDEQEGWANGFASCAHWLTWRRIDRSVEAREDEMRDATSTVSAHIDENGMFVIRGRLAPEAGEVLRKALDAAGEKLFDNSDDRPPLGKQRADALALVAESAPACGLAPARGGDRYQVVVHVNKGELRSPEPTGEAVQRPPVSALEPPTRSHRSGRDSCADRDSSAAAERFTEDVSAETGTASGPGARRSSAGADAGQQACAPAGGARRTLVAGRSVRDVSAERARDAFQRKRRGPMDLRYVMDCIWRPPPHLEALVARQRTTDRAA